jgi:hypothetical protein
MGQTPNSNRIARSSGDRSGNLLGLGTSLRKTLATRIALFGIGVNIVINSRCVEPS